MDHSKTGTSPQSIDIVPKTESNLDEPTSTLQSVHTNTFAEILHHFRISIAVTTYQAGKLVFLRSQNTDGKLVVNTHFRNFRKPMGFIFERGRIAIGTNSEIWEFHDIPAVARRLELSKLDNNFDAVFLPRRCNMTGDIQIHEMVWVPNSANGGEPNSTNLSELWFINTRFSCLATRSDIYSFVPRWKPPFITALAPEDRCHLNGFCLRNGKIRYVTALGETDNAGGWRSNKRSGGVLVDLHFGENVTTGLSMPHSPRWHNEKLWLLESGKGGIGTIDERTGRYQEVCRLPGFTRGLDFVGPYAFIGLSQVRESAVFSGISIAEMPERDRCCGVWVLDTRTGQTVGFVKFTEGVQEIFAVQVMQGSVWPEVLNENQKQIAETYELELLSNVVDDR